MNAVTRYYFSLLSADNASAILEVIQWCAPVVPRQGIEAVTPCS